MTDPMTTPPSRPTWRTLTMVALWGATTAVVAYLLSRGNLVAFVLRNLEALIIADFARP